MTETPAALFVPDGDMLIPTDLARGPWSPDALHGGPTAAAVVRAVEHHLADEVPDRAFEVARLTLELLRPVPVAPLRIVTRTSRPGRKVTIVEASVVTGDQEVARAAVLALRRERVTLPARIQALAPPALPDEGPEAPPPIGSLEWVAFHNRGVDMRFVAGVWRQPGPATVWIRLRVPIVVGETATPATRAAAAADFGNGISSELDFGSWRFLNADLTLHLARPLRGDWVSLAARTVLGDFGAGIAESVVADRDGVFGRAVQSLLIEPA